MLPLFPSVAAPWLETSQRCRARDQVPCFSPEPPHLSRDSWLRSPCSSPALTKVPSALPPRLLALRSPQPGRAQGTGLDRVQAVLSPAGGELALGRGQWDRGWQLTSSTARPLTPHNVFLTRSGEVFSFRRSHPMALAELR